MLDQDDNFYLISWRFLNTCLQDDVWTFKGEVTSSSLLGVTGLKE